MNGEESAHRENGLTKILSKPQLYNFFNSILEKKRNRTRLVRKFVNPFPGCRILDIGCGTANILSDMPNSIGEYIGFDMNPSYIQFAKKRWKGKPNCMFFCQKVKDTTILEKEYYDIALAIGILHHLTDSEASSLFTIAIQALKINGVLITYDNAYVENQHWFAKWLISKDRGHAVRTIGEYRRLANQCFAEIEGNILHDTLKIPYTIFIMKCIKKNLSKQSFS